MIFGEIARGWARRWAAARLLSAAERGDAEAIGARVRSGADPDARDRWGNSALALACEGRHWEAMEALLDLGADPSGAGGPAPLFQALKGDKDGAAGAMERLIGAGASLEARDAQGWTPLMRAAFAGSLRQARVLLEAGADPNAADEHGQRALSVALGGSLGGLELRELAILLLDAGADPEARDELDRSPSDLARRGWEWASAEEIERRALARREREGLASAAKRAGAPREGGRRL